jgi:hypothetical protein
MMIQSHDMPCMRVVTHDVTISKDIVQFSQLRRYAAASCSSGAHALSASCGPFEDVALLCTLCGTACCVLPCSAAASRGSPLLGSRSTTPRGTWSLGHTALGSPLRCSFVDAASARPLPPATCTTFPLAPAVGCECDVGCWSSGSVTGEASPSLRVRRPAAAAAARGIRTAGGSLLPRRG